MIKRLNYLAGRAREAGLRVVFGKIWSHFSPWLYFPQYRLRRLRRADADALRSLREFGDSMRACLRPATNPVLAEEAVRNRFPCLGYGDGAIPRRSLWHQDQFHNFSWSPRYFPNVDFVAAVDRCDVKVPWEYSRLQYLLWLADGYLANPGKAQVYLHAYSDIVSDWMDNNPTGFGVNWTSAMEVAIRSVNLGLATSIFSDELDPVLLDRVVVCLDEHRLFMMRFPESSDVAGNHYLANLMGVHFISFLLHGANSPEAANDELAMVEEAKRQFEAAGGHLERAPTYHRLCLDIVAISIAIGHRSGHASPLLPVLDRGIAFCAGISSTEGKLPIFGDNDSGHVVWFKQSAREYSSLAEFSRVLGGGHSGTTDGDDYLRWLCAIAGPVSMPQTRVPDLIAPSLWDGDGFVAARQDDSAAVMRVGDQGLQGRAAHDHDDSMSIWFSAGRGDILVDAGCHSYTLDRQTRELMISSVSHNVVQPLASNRFEPVDGSVFKTVRGAPVARTYSAMSTQDMLTLKAELESTPGSCFIHCRREVNLVTGELRVSDTWRFAERQRAALRWHFAPGLTIEVDQGALTAAVFDEERKRILDVVITAEPGCEAATYEYEYSPVYGMRQTCNAMLITTPALEYGSVVTEFSLVSR